MNIKRIIREELRHLGNEDEWDFNRIKLNTRLILPHTGVILKIVGFNPKYGTLKICGDFGCSKISIQNLQALIKDGTYKILKESNDLDWIKDVPNIYIGMCLIKYNYGGGTNQYIVKEIDSEDVVTLEEINGWPDDEYDIDDLTDLIADGSFKPC